MVAFNRLLGANILSWKVLLPIVISTILYGQSSGYNHLWIFSAALEMFGLTVLFMGRVNGRSLRPWELTFALINYRILIVLTGTFWLVGSHQMVFPQSFLATSIFLCYIFGYIICAGVFLAYIPLRLFSKASKEWQKFLLIFFVMLFWDFGIYLWPANSWLSFGYSDHAVKVFYWLGHAGARVAVVLLKSLVLYFVVSGRLNLFRGTIAQALATVLLVVAANVFTTAPPAGTKELSFAILQKGNYKPRGQDMKDAEKVIVEVTPAINAKLPDIVVWPENFFTGIVEDVDPVWRRIAREMPTQHVGGSIKFYEGTYRSTVDSIVGDTIQRQSKGTAFPMGEHLPFLSTLKAMGLIDPGYRNITVDQNYQPFHIQKYPDVKFLGLICLDGFNPWLIYHYLGEMNKSDVKPAFIIEIFNETLFGVDFAARQHLALMRIMSASFRLPMVHAGQAGISAMIRADGSVSGVQPYGIDGILRGTVSF